MNNDNKNRKNRKNRNKKKLGGRPPKYTKAEEMVNKINRYFESCFTAQRNRNGEIIIDENGNILKTQTRPFTISGLADALDMSRQSLLNYSQKEEFFDTIMRAKRKCEVYAEESLFYKASVNGAKFSLANNFEGWKDKQEIKHTGNLKLEDVL